MEKHILKQLTYDDALAIYNSNEWRNWTDDEIVKLQLFQKRRLVPFRRFHDALESVLLRPVFAHEFMYLYKLMAEYLEHHPVPTFEDISKLIPKDIIMSAQAATDEWQERENQYRNQMFEAIKEWENVIVSKPERAWDVSDKPSRALSVAVKTLKDFTRSSQPGISNLSVITLKQIDEIMEGAK